MLRVTEQMCIKFMKYLHLYVKLASLTKSEGRHIVCERWRCIQLFLKLLLKRVILRYRLLLFFKCGQSMEVKCILHAACIFIECITSRTQQQTFTFSLFVCCFSLSAFRLSARIQIHILWTIKCETSFFYDSTEFY